MTTVPTAEDAKSLARRLRRALADRGDDPGHALALELVAQAHPDGGRACTCQSTTATARPAARSWSRSLTWRPCTPP